MNHTDKAKECIRIAREYRAVAELRDFSEQDEHATRGNLTWRAMLPSRWNPTIPGRISQVLFTVLILPLTLLLVYAIAPIADRLRRRKRQRIILEHARNLRHETSGDSTANLTTHTNIYEFWCEHGLPDRSSTVEFNSRRECLERWVDALYGKGMSVVFRVKQRVDEIRAEHARSAAEFHNRGGHIQFMDPIDSVARELANRLPDFQSQ